MTPVDIIRVVCAIVSIVISLVAIYISARTLRVGYLKRRSQKGGYKTPRYRVSMKRKKP